MLASFPICCYLSCCNWGGRIDIYIDNVDTSSGIDIGSILIGWDVLHSLVSVPPHIKE